MQEATHLLRISTFSHFKESCNKEVQLNSTALPAIPLCTIAAVTPFKDACLHVSFLLVDGSLFFLHKPLFETNTKFITKKSLGNNTLFIVHIVYRVSYFALITYSFFALLSTDIFEGVLGRIPSHSVKAPRPLLQIKAEQQLEGMNECCSIKATHFKT